MDGVLGIPAAIVVVTVIGAACTDFWSFTVPNTLTLPFLVGGILYHTAVNGMPGFGASLAGALLAFVVLILPYISGGMGAGDVKLVAGVGAWLGVPAIIYVLLASCIAAGAYSVVLALVQGRVAETWLNVLRMLPGQGRERTPIRPTVETVARQSDRRRRLVPFAAMVALGVLATLVWR